jgi:hypothetical protein
MTRHIVAPTTGTTNSGSRINTRTRRRKRKGWANSSASPRPARNSTTTAPVVNSVVTTTARVNSGSPTRRV